MKGEELKVADVLNRTLETPNECDSNLEPANVVDGLFFIGKSIRLLARTIEEVFGSNPPTGKEGGE